EHRELAREAALASIVLLKNEDAALPLTAPGRVAVIGHLGTRVMTDWYSGTLPYGVTIADGLRAEFPEAEIDTADGADLVVLRDVEGIGEFGPFRHQDWGTSVQCPLPVHTLQSVENGRYLTLTGADDTEIEAAAATPDGWFVKELWEFEGDGDELLLRSNAPHSRKYARLDRATGRLLADAETPEQATRFRLEVVGSGIDEAAAAAGAADRVVVVLGNDPHINGRETIDRDSLALPPQQERLLHAVLAANPNTVLVLVSSYPYAIDWATDHVPAIVWTSHGGQELGTAVARVLGGRHNPSGRLPQTWYSAAAELPDRADYDVIGSQWTYRYSRRPHIYPFGHGLSYASYQLSDPAVVLRKNGPGALTVSAEVSVANTSDVAGHEVVQLYARRVGGTELRSLVGFDRIRVDAGDSRRVTFEVPPELLRTGEYEFEFGRSSADPDAIVTRLELS
ncbi:MAG TPA: glycoside hydrolase family 3 C-terminal domain-containing protein, partial [Actinospica sp.]|nr:glycoside hydrolase family 3 C-terminal domain-containing protein [Actinospica sp.]